MLGPQLLQSHLRSSCVWYIDMTNAPASDIRRIVCRMLSQRPFSRDGGFPRCTPWSGVNEYTGTPCSSGDCHVSSESMLCLIGSVVLLQTLGGSEPSLIGIIAESTDMWDRECPCHHGMTCTNIICAALWVPLALMLMPGFFTPSILNELRRPRSCPSWATVVT